MTKISPPAMAALPGPPIANAARVTVRNAPANPAGLAKAAQDFEAMAIGELLQPMFDTVDTAHSLFGGGNAEAAWRPMMVQEIAKQIAAHGGLGLARPVYAEMLRMQAAKSK